jgi:flagellar biosynthesis GTPase FlhF
LRCLIISYLPHSLHSSYLEPTHPYPYLRMEDPPGPPRLSPGVKRSHDGHIVSSSNHPNDTTPIRHLQPLAHQRSQSPALSTTSSSLSDLSSSVHQNPLAASSGSPSKKQKLTFAEKQVKQAEKIYQKEERARLKAGEKAKKEDEKRLKDEEKRKKAEEKEAAKRVKDIRKAEKDAAREEKKKMKDAEKANKEAEKLKKERVGNRDLFVASTDLIIGTNAAWSFLWTCPSIHTPFHTGRRIQRRFKQKIFNRVHRHGTTRDRFEGNKSHQPRVHQLDSSLFPSRAHGRRSYKSISKHPPYLQCRLSVA